MKTKRSKIRWKRYLPLYLMMVPGIIYLLVNNYMPMSGLILAFKRFNYSLGIWQSPKKCKYNIGYNNNGNEIRNQDQCLICFLYLYIPYIIQENCYGYGQNRAKYNKNQIVTDCISNDLQGFVSCKQICKIG